MHGSTEISRIWTSGKVNLPGIFAVAALVFSIFPKSFTALAFTEGVFVLGCIGFVYLLFRQWRAPLLSAVLSTMTAAIATNLTFYNERGNLTEIYLLWPTILSMYFFSKASPNWVGGWVLLAGFFSGVACLFKPPGLSPILAQGTFVFILWAVVKRFSFRHLMISVLTNTAGALLAWLPVGLYFLLHKAFRELIKASFIYNIKYGVSSQLPLLRLPFQTLLNLDHLASLVVCAAAGSLVCLTRSRTLWQQRELQETHMSVLCLSYLVLLWILFDLLGALAGGRNYPHYFLPLTLSLSVGAGMTYWLLYNEIRGKTHLQITLAALLIGPLLFPQASDFNRMISLLRNGAKETAWHQVATYLNAVRNPEDTLFIWGYLPGIYVVTGMKSPLRLLDTAHLRDFSPNKLEEEIFGGLEQAPPTFIVEQVRDEANGAPTYERLRQLLREGYTLLPSGEQFRVYRRHR